MKEIFALLLCFILVLSLVACGTNGTDSDLSSATQDATQSTDGIDSDLSSATQDATQSTDGIDSDLSSVTQDATQSTDGIDSDLSSATQDAAQSTDGTDSATSDNKTDTDSQETAPSIDRLSNLVMANDQIKGRLVVYDLDRYEEGDVLEDLEVWSVKTGHAAGLKYRENTVFGDVVLVAGTRSSIFEYPSGKEIWGTNNPGTNTHSVELLPGGNIVFANSSGNNLRVFYTSSIAIGTPIMADVYDDYALADAHGVLWDPEYEILWALGKDELVAYRVEGEGTGQMLKRVNDMGATLPAGKTGGHDLSPDYTDTRYLYVTVNSCILRFDKKTGTFDTEFEHYDQLNEAAVKGFSNNFNNNFFLSYPIDDRGTGTNFEGHSSAAWLTDTIYFCYRKTENVMYKQAIKSEHSGFYKVRAFVGQYQ